MNYVNYVVATRSVLGSWFVVMAEVRELGLSLDSHTNINHRYS